MVPPEPWTFDPVPLFSTLGVLQEPGQGAKPIPSLRDTSTIKDVFQFLFDNALLEEITARTNDYIIASNPNVSKVSSSNVLKYILVSLYMGYVKLPNRRSHWSDDELFTKSPFITHMLSRDKYDFLHKVVHFPDIETLCTTLEKKFLEMWTPYKFVTVDECMVKFKGRYG